MNFGPKQYYVPVEPSVPMAPKRESINVYFRTTEGKLGQLKWEADDAYYKEPHKEAIITVQEALVADGDGLENKAVLAVIKGGKQ
jgi:hypothetical protein